MPAWGRARRSYRVIEVRISVPTQFIRRLNASRRLWRVGQRDDTACLSRLVQNAITLRLLLAHDVNEAERPSGVAVLGQWREEGRLADTVGRRLPLECIAEGHETVERRGPRAPCSKSFRTRCSVRRFRQVPNIQRPGGHHVSERP